ncbi:MAG TPA: hypothetical protein QGF95_27470 [Candidatus Latescibacteria bacterium]|jgi:hypothetical protein|nr:hypothetical protein [Candidatus Latescibacterota bacterium]HJP34304.1 hypothetical protein [Candidatus Latescibacterota bacterium]
MVQTFAKSSDKKRKDIIDTVNSLNAAATVARFYIDDDGDTMMEAWFPGKYDKKLFGNFLEAWQGDTKGQATAILTLVE